MLKAGGFTTTTKQPIDIPPANIPYQKQETAIWRRTLRLSNLVSALLAIATLTGLYLFWPKVGIEPYASRDPHDPFAQQFFVQNNSIYSLRDLNLGCSIEHVETEPSTKTDIPAKPGQLRGSLEQFSITTEPRHMGELAPDAKRNVTCAFGQIIPADGWAYTNLEIAVWINFRLPLGIRKCRGGRFTGVSASDYSFLWTYNGQLAQKECPMAEFPN
jgi:hypothetical protein